jgi:hypothetical protein
MFTLRTLAAVGLALVMTTAAARAQFGGDALKRKGPGKMSVGRQARLGFWGQLPPDRAPEGLVPKMAGQRPTGKYENALKGAGAERNQHHQTDLEYIRVKKGQAGGPRMKWSGADFDAARRGAGRADSGAPGAMKNGIKEGSLPQNAAPRGRLEYPNLGAVKGTR